MLPNIIARVHFPDGIDVEPPLRHDDRAYRVPRLATPGAKALVLWPTSIVLPVLLARRYATATIYVLTRDGAHRNALQGQLDEVRREPANQGGLVDPRLPNVKFITRFDELPPERKFDYMSLILPDLPAQEAQHQAWIDKALKDTRTALVYAQRLLQSATNRPSLLYVLASIKTYQHLTDGHWFYNRIAAEIKACSFDYHFFDCIKFIEESNQYTYWYSFAISPSKPDTYLAPIRHYENILSDRLGSHLTLDSLEQHRAIRSEIDFLTKVLFDQLAIQLGKPGIGQPGQIDYLWVYMSIPEPLDHPDHGLPKAHEYCAFSDQDEQADLAWANGECQYPEEIELHGDYHPLQHSSTTLPSRAHMRRLFKWLNSRTKKIRESESMIMAESFLAAVRNERSAIEVRPQKTNLPSTMNNIDGRKAVLAWLKFSGSLTSDGESDVSVARRVARDILDDVYDAGPNEQSESVQAKLEKWMPHACYWFMHLNHCGYPLSFFRMRLLARLWSSSHGQVQVLTSVDPMYSHPMRLLLRQLERVVSKIQLTLQEAALRSRLTEYRLQRAASQIVSTGSAHILGSHALAWLDHGLSEDVARPLIAKTRQRLHFCGALAQIVRGAHPPTHSYMPGAESADLETYLRCCCDGQDVELEFAESGRASFGVSLLAGSEQPFVLLLENFVRNCALHAARGATLQVQILIAEQDQDCKLTLRGPWANSESVGDFVKQLNRPLFDDKSFHVDQTGDRLKYGVLEMRMAALLLHPDSQELLIEEASGDIGLDGSSGSSLFEAGSGPDCLALTIHVRKPVSGEWDWRRAVSEDQRLGGLVVRMAALLSDAASFATSSGFVLGPGHTSPVGSTSGDTRQFWRLHQGAAEKEIEPGNVLLFPFQSGISLLPQNVETVAAYLAFAVSARILVVDNVMYGIWKDLQKRSDEDDCGRLFECRPECEAGSIAATEFDIVLYHRAMPSGDAPIVQEFSRHSRTPTVWDGGLLERLLDQNGRQRKYLHSIVACFVLFNLCEHRSKSL